MIIPLNIEGPIIAEQLLDNSTVEYMVFNTRTHARIRVVTIRAPRQFVCQGGSRIAHSTTTSGPAGATKADFNHCYPAKPTDQTNTHAAYTSMDLDGSAGPSQAGPAYASPFLTDLGTSLPSRSCTKWDENVEPSGSAVPSITMLFQPGQTGPYRISGISIKIRVILGMHSRGNTKLPSPLYICIMIPVFAITLPFLYQVITSQSGPPIGNMSIANTYDIGVPIFLRVEDANYPRIPRRFPSDDILMRLDIDTTDIGYRLSPEAFFVTPWEADRYISTCSLVILHDVSGLDPLFPGVCILFEPCEIRQFGGAYHYFIPGWRFDDRDGFFHACDFWIPARRIRLSGDLAFNVSKASHVALAREVVMSNYQYDLVRSITPVRIRLNGYRAPVNVEAVLGDDYGISTMLYPQEAKTVYRGRVETRLTRMIKRHAIPAIVAKLCGL
ncbi:hypothetical protein C8Q73DRAFT_665509 [Cubamyces lactineus]|nr:hypothetical protein C8Q73DRAFT_665509 [Cubamyces lactineus]